MSSTRSYRLCGEVDGRWESFSLVSGDNHVGSLPSNDVPLRESGVSRHHAVLEVEGADVTVIDLASKNGTLVNDERVGRATLGEGDHVTFGRCTLTLEALAPDEAELAIRFRARRLRDASSQAARDTTYVAVGGTGASPAMRCATALAERLCDRAGPNVGGALNVIREALDATACWLLGYEDGRQSMIAVAGAADDRLWSTVARRFDAALAGRPPDSAPPTTPGCILGAGDQTLGLWVAEPQVHEGGEDLLRFALLLIGRLREGPETAVGRTVPAAGVRDLVLPDGHVPGRSAAMAALYDQLRALAQGDLSALILGETGVGKEHLAHIVHASSSRVAEPFVAVNCAAVPNDLLEAELFGVAAGAATGVTAREGTFQRAHRGTLFLDEIGDMTPALQAKLLRALQEREVQPVGGRVARIDVRVVAATNVDLGSRISAGQFRADLYYRLAGFTLDVPPLRERREDIPALVEHFIRRASSEIGKPIRGVSVRALRQLMAHDWPGNVRELENEVRRLVYRCRAGQVIDGDVVRLPPRTTAAAPEAARAPSEVSQTTSPAAPDPFADTLDLATLERRAIVKALAATGGVGVKAARLLGISRDALRRRIERYGLTSGRGADSPPKLPPKL